MNRAVKWWLLVWLVLCVACGPASNQQAAIIAATQQYIQQNSQVNQVRIDVQAIDGDFARVEVDPVGDTAEPATAFLKRENGTWQVLTIGSAFDRDTYDQYKIPLSLRV